MRFSRSSRGLTFLEVVISAGLLMVMMGMALQLFSGFSNNVSQNVSTMDLDAKVVRTEKLLRTELKAVSASSIVLSDPNGWGRNTRLVYTPVLGYDAVAEAPIFDRARQLEIVLDASETRDDTSQDGDRYVDEGRLVLSIDTNGNGTFEASEQVLVATNVASEAETYGGVPVGLAFSFDLGGPTTYVDQATTGALVLNMTFLGAAPNNATSVSVRNHTWNFAIRNP